MVKRKLPEVGDTVAYTRDFIMNVRSKADWRGVIIQRCEYYTPQWPMVEVQWTRGDATGVLQPINAGNLCKIRSVAFIESAPVYSPIA